MPFDLFLEGTKKTETSKATTEPETTQQEGVVINGREEEQTAEEILSRGLSQMTTNADTDVDTSKDKTESVTSGPTFQVSLKEEKEIPNPLFLEKEQKEGESGVLICGTRDSHVHPPHLPFPTPSSVPGRDPGLYSERGLRDLILQLLQRNQVTCQRSHSSFLASLP
jgi:hypothetical protein